MNKPIRSLQDLIERSIFLQKEGYLTSDGVQAFKDSFHAGQWEALEKVGLAIAHFANYCAILNLSPDELVATVDQILDLRRDDAANSRSKPS